LNGKWNEELVAKDVETNEEIVIWQKLPSIENYD